MSQRTDPIAGDDHQGPASIRKVLIVDDSRLQRRILSGSLSRWGYEISEAESGLQALDLCRSLKPDLILSDWMMPGMDGLEFCREFRSLPEDFYAYFILLTSKSDKMEIAQGLDAGADDFLTKPVNTQELRARISAGERILAMQRELSDKNRVIGETLDRLQAVYDSIDRDLMQARKIQESLVPEMSRDFGAARVSLLLEPCGHIGGDLVGMFSPAPGQLALYAIDVSGHGITSAMMTARLAGYLSGRYLDENLGVKRHGAGGYTLRPPDDVARQMNDRLLDDAGIDEYFTIAYATLDLATGALALVQAGHPHPMILRKGSKPDFVGEGGVPLGLIEGPEFSVYKTTLAPGDRVLLYSDGFTEAETKRGGMLDYDGLAELVEHCDPKGSGKEVLQDLYWALTKCAPPGTEMEDDISAVFLEYIGQSNST